MNHKIILQKFQFFTRCAVCFGCILHFRHSMPFCGVCDCGRIRHLNWNFWFHHRASVCSPKNALRASTVWEIKVSCSCACFTLQSTNLYEFISLSLLFTINLNINLIRIFYAKHFRVVCWCVWSLFVSVCVGFWWARQRRNRLLLRTLHSPVVHFF